MADNSDRARTGMDPRRRRLASQLKGKQPEGDDTAVAASCGCAGPDAAVPGEQIVAEAGAPTALIVYKRRARQPPAALPRGCSPFPPIATVAPPRGRSDTGPGPGPDERRVTKPPARSTVLTVSDKGKGVATEHALVRQLPEGFMADARRGRQPLAVLPATEQTSDSQMRGGFMADARRARQPPPAPLNHPSLSSTSRPRYGSERYIATVDFLLKPKGSKVKKPFTLCKEVFSNLLAHQVEGLDWLWNIHCCGTGGIIGDDMGIGKTKQILAFITGLFESDLIKTALVVVPSSVIHQWTKEMERNGLKKYVHIFQDKLTRNEELDVVRQSGGILVTTHTLATNNWSMLNVPWDYFVIDEAHMTCKKECLKAYQNLQKIDCPHKILLTGTPSANTLKELRAMLNFCCPGLFSSLPDFYEDYFAPIVLGNFKSSSLSQLKESSIAVKKLQHLISPCLLRRTKSVLSSEDTPESKRLDLPEKLEFVVWLRLSVYQEKLYRTVLTSNIIDKSNQAELMVASTVLQKICNHPCNLDSKDQGKLNGDKRTVLKRIVRKLSSTISLSERNVSADHHSCKVDIIVRLLKRFRKQDLKALIFSRTCEMLDVIQEVLLKKEFLFDRIDGSLSAKERKKRLEAFKEDAGAPILLISSFAGGTGLDLPIASRAIIVEPFWNPSLDDQCADRIYRVGQKKKCIVYRLVCSETVEEIVYRTQIFKLGISNAVLEKKEIKRYIEFELKKSLLDIPPKGFENSRTLRQLEKDPPPTMSNEMCEELHFLKNLDVLGVTFHGELFQGASSKSPIRSVPSVSTDEIDWAIDEEELSRARTNEIIELEARIERYKHILNNQGLPDGGAKIIIMIESIEQKLAKLRSNTDPKEPKDNT